MTTKTNQELLEKLCLTIIEHYVNQHDFVSANYVCRALQSEWNQILRLADVFQEIDAERQIRERMGLTDVYKGSDSV